MFDNIYVPYIRNSLTFFIDIYEDRLCREKNVSKTLFIYYNSKPALAEISRIIITNNGVWANLEESCHSAPEHIHLLAKLPLMSEGREKKFGFLFKADKRLLATYIPVEHLEK